MKSGSTERLFVNGAQVLQRSNALPTITRVANMASIGKGFSSKNFFPGDIAEIIVYKRALSDTERASVEAYLKAKYGF
jgi:hypothetical protein